MILPILLLRILQSVHHQTSVYLKGRCSSSPGSNALCNTTSGLVDPLTQTMHICVAHSPLANGSDILLQVMNISPTPVTIYKGTKLATMVPCCVSLVTDTSCPRSDWSILLESGRSHRADPVIDQLFTCVCWVFYPHRAYFCGGALHSYHKSSNPATT